MIASPADNRRLRLKDPLVLASELDCVERADGRLDRHAGYVPERHGYSLDDLHAAPRTARPSVLAQCEIFTKITWRAYLQSEGYHSEWTHTGPEPTTMRE